MGTEPNMCYIDVSRSYAVCSRRPSLLMKSFRLQFSVGQGVWDEAASSAVTEPCIALTVHGSCLTQMLIVNTTSPIISEGVIGGPKRVWFWHDPRVWSPWRAGFKISVK
jgi:hypothetical protein